MGMLRSFKLVRAKRFFRLGHRQVHEDFASVVTAPRTIFYVLFCSFGLWVILKYLEIESVIAALPMWVAHTATVFLAVLGTFLIGVLTAPWRARRNEALLGTWIGSQFVYHVPHHVLTVKWTTAENGKGVRFIVDDAEPKSSASFKIEVDGGGKRVVTDINHKHWELGLMSKSGLIRSQHRTHQATAGPKRDFTLYADSLPGTDPVIIKVYVLSFDLND
jgi:hypothetical protein